MLEALIVHYGYIALFAGSFLEGEVMTVIGGILTRLGYFHLPLVLIIVYVGTLTGDQAVFLLGRKHGAAFLKKRPHLHARSERVHDLIDNHKNKILFGFRFLYGLRIPTLIALGTSSISTKRFFWINAIGAFVWTLVFVIGGYFFGDLFLLFLSNVKHYERPLFIGLGIMAVVIWIISIIKHRSDY